MCGEIGEYDGDYDDGGGTTLAPVTMRARKEYRCVACRGLIAPGGYHARWTVIDDGRASSLRVHLQCRDHSLAYRLIGWDVLTDAAENDEELGPEWLEHRRSLYEWAAGGEYTYGQRWTAEEIDAAKARAAQLRDELGWSDSDE